RVLPSVVPGSSGARRRSSLGLAAPFVASFPVRAVVVGSAGGSSEGGKSDDDQGAHERKLRPLPRCFNPERATDFRRTFSAALRGAGGNLLPPSPASPLEGAAGGEGGAS